MRRKILTITLLCGLSIMNCASKNIPDSIPGDIQKVLLKMKEYTILKLDSCRTNNSSGRWYADLLSKSLWSYSVYKKHADILDKVNLEWKMLYDDAMIERIIQLLNNEYKEDELSTLVNKQMDIFFRNSAFDYMVMSHIKADTSICFLQVQDSLNRHRDKNIHKGLFQTDEVFRYLGMDTTARYHFLVDSFRKDAKEKVIQTYLTQVHFDIDYLIRQCGQINDERLIKPLIYIMENPGRFKPYKPDYLKQCVIDAFIQMKIEPYLSECLKSNTHSLEEIKKKEIVPGLGIFAEFLHSQESFRELSKYLLSSAYTMYTSEGPAGVAYETAFRYFMEYIENEGLWEITGNPDTFDIKEGRFKIYEWMQENYGKYKIKRLW
jgi:hypothetical protein